MQKATMGGWTRKGRTWTLRRGGEPVARVREYEGLGYRYWRVVAGGRLNPFWFYSLQRAKDRAYLGAVHGVGLHR